MSELVHHMKGIGLNRVALPPDTNPVSYGIYDLPEGVVFYMPRTALSDRFITIDQASKVVQPQIRTVYPAAFHWQGIVIWILFLMIVVGKYSYPRRFKQYLQSSLSNSNLINLGREWNPLKSSLAYMVLFVYVLILAMLMKTTLSYLGYESLIYSDQISDFLFFAGLTFLLVFGKLSVIHTFSRLFNMRDQGLFFAMNQIVFSFTLLVILFPLLVLLVYSPSLGMLLAIISIAALLFGFRLFRIIQIGFMKPGYPLLYLFLYLCTLEIVPILLLSKAIYLTVNGVEIG